MRVANGERYSAFPTQNPQRKSDGEAWRLFIVGLALIFITLKLSGHLTWSWLWILSPLWIPPVVLAGVCVAAFLAACVVVVYKKLRKK